MPRRIQFKGICHDILDSFVSRYNDIGGYWALGIYARFLMRHREETLHLNLSHGKAVPEDRHFNISAAYYWQAILQVMAANKMPESWLKDACIKFKIDNSDYAYCSIEIESDLNKIFSYERSVLVFPHNPDNEQRRMNSFGPSNQKMLHL